MQIITRTSFFIRILIIVPVILVLLYGCRKSFDGHTVSNEIPPSEIATLKALFISGTGSSANANGTQVNSSGNNKIVKSLNIDWNKYLLKNRPDGKVVHFDIPDEPELVVPGKLETGQPVLFRNRTSAVFIEYGNGVKKAFFMKVIEFLKDKDARPVTDSIYYDHIPKNFNGLILYYTLKQDFINGAQFVKGVPVYKVSTTTLNAPQSNAAKLKVNYAPPPTDCEFVDYYEVYCEWGGTADDPYQNFHGCTEQYQQTIEICDGSDPGSGGATGDTGYGGGTVCSSCAAPPLPQLINNVKNDCLHKMVDIALNKNVTGTLGSMIYDVYGQQLTPHLVISDVTTLAATRDGETQTTYQSNNQIAYTLMSLNANTLPNSSTEFIVATILHEAGHSLVNFYHPEDNIDGENQLAVDYQNQIAIELKNMFPTLTNAQATALAWGGLENTPLYQQQIGVNAANYSAINAAFRNGTSGSKPCSSAPVE